MERDKSRKNCDVPAVERTQRAAACDRLVYLRSLSKDCFEQSQPLDLPHQSVLRIYATTPALGGALAAHELAEAYWSNPARRREMWQEAVQHLRSVAGDARGLDVPYGPTLKYCGTPAINATVFRTAIERDPAAADRVRFANEHGFARFGAVRDLIGPFGTPVKVLAGTEELSVGAMMFYGFRLGMNSPVYLQQTSVRLLGATMAWVREHGMPPGLRQSWTTAAQIHELRSVELSTPDSADAVEIFTNACTEFLITHELGHQYVAGDFTAVRDFLHAHDIDPDSVSFVDFPTSNDLLAWRRVRDGAATPRDILFLYGDLVANLVAVGAGLSPVARSALNAFNLWLTVEHPPTGRPRGNVELLTAADRSDIDGFLGHLGHLLGALRTAPDEVAPRMREREAVTWKRVGQRYFAAT